MALKINSEKIMDIYGRLRQRVPFLIRRPLGYFFYLTARCNLSCDYCWQREIPLKGSGGTRTAQCEFTAEEWIRVIQSVPGSSFIGLTGGEPLLHKGFTDIVKFLGSRVRYTINTNGLLVDDGFIDLIVEHKLTNLSISIDGFADIHDRARRHEGLFDHIVEAVKRLNVLKKKKNLGRPSLTIKTVLLDPLVDRLDEFYRFCDETLKADCLNVSIMKTGNHSQYDFRVYEDLKGIHAIGGPECYGYARKKDIPGALMKIMDLSRHRRCKVLYYPRMNTPDLIGTLFSDQGKGAFGPCYIPWTFVVILGDGTVIPCLSVKMANMRELDYDVRKIRDLMRYKDFLKWRSMMNNKKRSPAECNMCCFSTVKKMSNDSKT